jgi:ABC-type Zn uptake system ZnuABC Zn-binding protein ZnuA
MLSLPVPRLLSIFVLAMTLWGCQQASSNKTPNRVTLVATTVHLGEVLGRLAPADWQVVTLVPAGADPHTFEPKPADMSQLEKASLLFCNGAGLEGWLNQLVSGREKSLQVVDVSSQIPLRKVGGESDPHFWQDPTLMQNVTRQVATALVELEPPRKALIEQNCRTYIDELIEVDRWASQRLEGIPSSQRRLVTSHDALGYFARRYQFTIEASVLPGLTTDAAEASAKEILTLLGKIRGRGVRAVFAETSDNPQLYQQLAQDAQVKLVPDLLLDSLGPVGSATGTYVGAFRHNVERIASALE